MPRLLMDATKDGVSGKEGSSIHRAKIFTRDSLRMTKI